MGGLNRFAVDHPNDGTLGISHIWKTIVTIIFIINYVLLIMIIPIFINQNM